jgi:Spy/CpxP family protein refolding chaperone
MRRLTGGVALVATVMTLTPLSADAQRGPRGQRGFGPGIQGQGVEVIMRLRERLELSEDQIRQLDQIREEAVRRRNAHRAEMEELTSRVRAGQMEAAELRDLARQRREAAKGIRDADRERVEAILTEDQRASLETLRGQARAFQRGRQSTMRGRGFRGPDGAWRRGTGTPRRAPRPGMWRRGGMLGPEMQDPGAEAGPVGARPGDPGGPEAGA